MAIEQLIYGVIAFIAAVALAARVFGMTEAWLLSGSLGLLKGHLLAFDTSRDDLMREALSLCRRRPAATIIFLAPGCSNHPDRQQLLQSMAVRSWETQKLNSERPMVVALLASRSWSDFLFACRLAEMLECRLNVDRSQPITSSLTAGKCERKRIGVEPYLDIR